MDSSKSCGEESVLLYFRRGDTEGALGMVHIWDQREKREDFLHLALPACLRVQSLTFLQNRPLLPRVLELIQSTPLEPQYV